MGSGKYGSDPSPVITLIAVLALTCLNPCRIWKYEECKKSGKSAGYCSAELAGCMGSP